MHGSLSQVLLHASLFRAQQELAPSVDLITSTRPRHPVTVRETVVQRSVRCELKCKVVEKATRGTHSARSCAVITKRGATADAADAALPDQTFGRRCVGRTKVVQPTLQPLTELAAERASPREVLKGGG